MSLSQAERDAAKQELAKAGQATDDVATIDGYIKTLAIQAEINQSQWGVGGDNRRIVEAGTALIQGQWLGRKLTPTEEKTLYQNATAVEVPKDVHQSGPTYGGKNTAAQVQQDAIDLCGAVCRDTDSLRGNMIDRGYDPKQVDEAIKQIIDRNRQTGVIK